MALAAPVARATERVCLAQNVSIARLAAERARPELIWRRLRTATNCRGASGDEMVGNLRRSERHELPSGRRGLLARQLVAVSGSEVEVEAEAEAEAEAGVGPDHATGPLGREW